MAAMRSYYLINCEACYWLSKRERGSCDLRIILESILQTSRPDISFSLGNNKLPLGCLRLLVRRSLNFERRFCLKKTQVAQDFDR